MQTWTDTMYCLHANDHLLVVPHEGAVSLSLPGYQTDGRGLSLRLLPAHLPELRQAMAALEAVAVAQQADEAPCPVACLTCECRRPCGCDGPQDAGQAPAVVAHDVF